MDKDEIIEKLKDLLEFSYSPYSKIKVSSAVKFNRVGLDVVEFGTNVENISYGLTNCAERTAVFSAITKGMKSIKEVYIMSNLEEPIMPCGACRQVLSEFIPNPDKVNVICLNEVGDEKVFKFSDLLPYKF